MPRAMLIDTSRCIGCRACQVACKQWNELPEEQTRNRGSYQNPPDLSAATWTLVRFRETRKADGQICWTFFKDQCRHCLDPLCVQSLTDAGLKNSAYKDADTGAVLYTTATKAADSGSVACPYGIPRQDPVSKELRKCTMCHDRVTLEGLEPACVKTCPSGALAFGDRAEILKLAAVRLDLAKKQYPEAQIINADDTSVIHLLVGNENDYEMMGKVSGSDIRHMARAEDELAAPV